MIAEVLGVTDLPMKTPRGSEVKKRPICLCLGRSGEIRIYKMLPEIVPKRGHETVNMPANDANMTMRVAISSRQTVPSHRMVRGRAVEQPWTSRIASAQS